MSPLFTDTTCTLDVGSASWEVIYKLFEDENPRVIVKQIATIDVYPRSNDVAWNDVANSFLNIIDAYPKILPYVDTVRWVVDQLDIIYRMFITPRKIVIGSFKAKDLRKMCHLPPPQKRYDTQFIEKFMQENLNPADLIRERRRDQNKTSERTGVCIHWPPLLSLCLILMLCFVASMVIQLHRNSMKNGCH